MIHSMFFYKQLTKAEVGQAGTHEIYIRLSNGFDYETFFGDTPQVNENGTITINFEVINSSIRPEQPVKVPLRFVYYSNSNKEKRIPSLSQLFKDNNVEIDDIVCLESCRVDDKYSFYIRFFKKGTIHIEPSSFSFTTIEEHKQNFISTDIKIIPHQIIYYGAPGTGKSSKIKKILEDKNVSKENIFRTTFHPDSDYSSFVGAYKPTMDKPIEKIYVKGELISKLTAMKNEGITYSPQKFGAKYWRSLKQLNLYDKKDILQACGMSDNYIVEFDKGMAIGEEYLACSNESNIIYSFVPQTFLNAYLRAYQKTDENVYLVIEEINRGNCAQIFGDLFQLLDRDAEGKSDYTIKADTDLRAYLEEKLGTESEGIKNGELCLPPNLYIFATMNTSDQSLFPIDSAFKRRWDWEYEPIKYKNKDWKIVVGDKEYSWVSFQKIVNDRIFDSTNSEDKMLGDYFVHPHDGVVTEKMLLNKVLFYLWNDVCKDGEGDIFKMSDTEEVTFSELYGAEGQRKLMQMMKSLGIELVSDTTNETDKENTDEVDSDQSKDLTRYSINGASSVAKRMAAAALVKQYISNHPELSATEVVNNWKTLGTFVSHFIETQAEFEKRRDKNPRVEEIECNKEKIYVSTNGWGGQGIMDNLISAIPEEWNLKVEKVN